MLIAGLGVTAIGGFLLVPYLFPRIYHTQLAKNHQYIAQAICDYKADHGLYPYELKDLFPAYLPTVPTASYSNNVLYIHTGLPHTYVTYAFGRSEGWHSSGDFGVGALPVPNVVPLRPALAGEELVQARLVEYDRRIASATRGRYFLTEKICYLVSLQRTTDAYAECQRAAAAYPDWWRPRMGLAVLASPADAAKASEDFQGWVAKHPAFIRYCYLARYLRDRGRARDAVAALREAARFPVEDVDGDSMWVPNAFAFDAASFACQQRDPELVLAITKVWAAPRGVYSNPGPDLHAFSAAAHLALGRMEEAKREIDCVVAVAKNQRIWAGNLQSLASAVEKGDRSFVYDPGVLCCGGDWTLFPAPDE